MAGQASRVVELKCEIRESGAMLFPIYAVPSLLPSDG